MPDEMAKGARRGLTQGERARLSPGLAAALDGAGVQPRLVSRIHPGARVAALWCGGPPILARPNLIFWPRALGDYACSPAEVFATLQHELQHLLDYATGALTGAGYLLRPRNWRYAYALTPASRWRDFGAEQRASIAEHLWLLEEGRKDAVRRALGGQAQPLGVYRDVVPWASAPHTPLP